MSGCRESHVVTPSPLRLSACWRRRAPHRSSMKPLGFITSFTGRSRRTPTPGLVRIPLTSEKYKKPHLAMRLFIFVGLPGIEPGLYEPESYVLPVYYSPMNNTLNKQLNHVKTDRRELYARACVLAGYYSPMNNTLNKQLTGGIITRPSYFSNLPPSLPDFMLLFHFRLYSCLKFLLPPSCLISKRVQFSFDHRA